MSVAAASSVPPLTVVDGEAEGLRAGVAANVARLDGQVVDAVVKGAGVELLRELEEVRAALLIRVVVPEDRLVLVRAARVDSPERRVRRHRGAEVECDALRNDHAARDPADLPRDQRRRCRAVPGA